MAAGGRAYIVIEIWEIRNGNGTQPKGLRGRAIRNCVEDLDAWIDKHRVELKDYREVG